MCLIQICNIYIEKQVGLNSLSLCFCFEGECVAHGFILHVKMELSF